MRDMHNRMAVAASINVASRTASVNGSGVDLQGYEGAMAAVAISTMTAGTHWTMTLEDSTDNSTFTAVGASDLVGANITISGVNNRAGGVGLEQSYVGTKRYLRAVATKVGASTATGFGVIIVRGFPRSAPVS